MAEQGRIWQPSDAEAGFGVAGSGAMTKSRGTNARGYLFALAVLACLGRPAHASDIVIEVTLDKAKVLRMPPKAETIVVGNPGIADVTTLKNGLVVVTGKGFGETNIIFLDGAGGAIQEAGVRVMASTSLMVVQRGAARESYACQPRCQPTVSLGDSLSYLTDTSGQITARNAVANPVSH